MATVTNRAHVLSEDEQARTLSMIGSRSRFPARDKAIFALSHCAGLRVGEIAALNLSDVLELGWDASPRFKLKVQATLTKTKGSKPRVIYLDSPLLGKALIQHLEERLRMGSRLQRKSDVPQPLFMTQKSNRFNTSTLCQLFQRLYGPSWAGIKNAKGHSGRRTYITNLAEQGYNLKAIAVLAGHSNIQTTAIYIDTNPLQLKRMAASATSVKLERLL